MITFILTLINSDRLSVISLTTCYVNYWTDSNISNNIDINAYKDNNAYIDSIDILLSKNSWSDKKKTHAVISEIIELVLKDKAYLNAIYNSDEDSVLDEFNRSIQLIMLGTINKKKTPI